MLRHCDCKEIFSVVGKAAKRLVWLFLFFPFLGVGDANFPLFEQRARALYGDTAGDRAAEFVALIQNLQNADTETRLQRVNTFFNSRIRFTDDSQIWRQKDYWASPLETIGKGAGDCEDFTIAKFTALRLLGVPVNKLRLTYVKARIGGQSSSLSEAHMVLSYYENPSDIPLVLDNLVDSIRPATQRPDLTPVFGFNSEGLWLGNQTQASNHDPKIRLSRWRDVLLKIRNDGLD